MKKTYTIIFFIAIALFLSCKESINQSDTPVPETVPLKLDFVNNNTIYDLDDGWATIQFSLTNISEKEIFVPAWFLQNGGYYISHKAQYYLNNNWITDYELTSDSTISIKPQSSIIGEFYVDEKGQWRIIVPVINQDSIISEEVFIINEIENHVTFNINQISGSNSLIVNIKNDTKEPFEVLSFTYPYCHFSYLSYSIYDKNKYKSLRWDDDLNEWNLVGSPVFAICGAEGPSISIEAESEFKDTVNVVLPSGNIKASIRLSFGNNMDDFERISQTFEYQK